MTTQTVRELPPMAQAVIDAVNSGRGFTYVHFMAKLDEGIKCIPVARFNWGGDEPLPRW